jgi:copper chaperone
MFKSVALEVVGDQRLACEDCEQRVEGLLKALQGVRQVRAQARNQLIEVLFDAAALDAAKIAERLGKAGYETKVHGSTSDSGERENIAGSGPLEDVRLLVPDMVCEGCAEKISAALNAVPGVREVKSKVRPKHVYIQYDPGRVQKEQLKEAVSKAGFTAVET